MLTLEKPIVFFDLETTGTSFQKDRILELYAKKINPDQTTQEIHYFFNPGFAIPQESIELHGITDDKVKDAPAFKEHAQEIAIFFNGADLAGYNSIKFDIPFLIEELLRNGAAFKWTQARYIDIYRMWYALEPRKLENAYSNFCGKTLDNAHDAKVDTEATIEIFESMADIWAEEMSDWDAVQNLSVYENERSYLDTGQKIQQIDGEYYFAFGQYKDKKLKDILQIDEPYFDWMIEDASFNYSTRFVVRALKKQLLQQLEVENKTVEDDVTHEKFFGENIDRIKKTLAS